MKLWAITSFLCGYMFLGINGQNFKYKLVDQRKSWKDADADCHSRDGSLVVIDTHMRVMDFQEHLMLEALTPVWTAAYRQHSPWVWVEGCFEAAFLTKNDAVRLPHNQASECASVCRNNTYIALKGHMCYCLSDIRSLLPLSALQCDTTCPGSSAEVCGGPSGAVSIYSLGGVNGYKESDRETADALQQGVHASSRSDWKNCVYILKHDTPVWITADCRKEMPFLCKIYRDSGSEIEYKSPRSVVGSWMESRDLCREEGGTLADLHANNMEAVNALPNHSQYWVGLYRNTSWTWHVDATEENPLWCTTVTEDEVGELQFKTESCSLPRKYVCQIPILKAQTAGHSQMVVYLAVGSVVWVLAIVTAIIAFYMVRRRGCCKRSDASDTGQIRSSYLDLEDDSSLASSRPSRQHSYVNSDVRNQPTCSSPPPSTDPPLKPGAAKASDQMARYQASNGNEYASVCMTKTIAHHVTGASGSSNRGSTSTEGDYDVVWDSMNFSKHLNIQSNENKRASTASDNIYTEIEKVTHVDTSKSGSSHLFPPMNEFDNLSETKLKLERTRSKST